MSGNTHRAILLCSGASATPELARLTARCAFQPLDAVEKVHCDTHRAILHLPPHSAAEDA
jgi:hypothetical protein